MEKLKRIIDEIRIIEMWDWEKIEIYGTEKKIDMIQKTILSEVRFIKVEWQIINTNFIKKIYPKPTKHSQRETARRQEERENEMKLLEQAKKSLITNQK